MKPALRLQQFLDNLDAHAIGVHKVESDEYRVWVGGPDKDKSFSGIAVEMEPDACWLFLHMTLKAPELSRDVALKAFHKEFSGLVGDDLVDLELESSQEGWNTTLVADFGKIDECIEWVQRALRFGLIRSVS